MLLRTCRMAHSSHIYFLGFFFVLKYFLFRLCFSLSISIYSIRFSISYIRDDIFFCVLFANSSNLKRERKPLDIYVFLNQKRNNYHSSTHFPTDKKPLQIAAITKVVLTILIVISAWSCCPQPRK